MDSNLFSYIENNISAELDTEHLSSIGLVSRSKLKNVFYSLSGHSVIEYVRKRRLSNALAHIKTSDMNMTNIALECGYSSHQALCRAVKQTLNLTPTKYKNSDTYYFFPPFAGEPLQSVTVSSIAIPQMKRINFYHKEYIGIENIAVNKFLQTFPNYKGRLFGRNGTQKRNLFCYEIYLTDLNINFDLLTPHGFETAGEVSETNTIFASTTATNNEHRINTAWNYLYSDWLSSSMFEYTGEPYYEEYIMRNNKPFKLKLYLPLKKRREETKISLINNPALRFITAEAKGFKAEETASRRVVEYLTKHCPHIINISKETYLQKGANSCVCGVSVSPAIQLADDDNVKSITTKHNKYLVFENGVMGDYDLTAERLLAFAKDNGMEADSSGVFAVYDARKGFHHLQMKMFCPVAWPSSAQSV